MQTDSSFDQRSSLRQRTLIALLMTASFFNYLDRMILPAVVQPIKAEFGLSDTQLGLLTGFAFVLLYAFASLPVARFADRRPRDLVLAGAFAFWSLATAACGLANSFLQLLAARACVGIGESACQPVGYAIVSERFPREKRNTAMSWFLLGNSLGVTAGFAIGGWLASRYGWRMAFIAVGLPGVLIAAALALVSHKTPRSAHRSAIAELGLLAALRLLLGNRTLMWLITLSGVYAFTIFGPIAWLPAFFVRSHGLPLSVVGLWAGLTIGLGMACANLISGPLADRMARRGPERPLLLGLAAILLSSLAFIAVLLTGSPRWAFAWTFVAALSGSIGSPIIASTIQNECPAELRATAASMGTLAVSLLGIGLAPFAIGVMSDALASSHGADSLRAALLASLCAGPITAAMYFRVARLPLTRAAASLAESPAHA